jgi:hypothetical protein
MGFSVGRQQQRDEEASYIREKTTEYLIRRTLFVRLL